MTCSTKILQSWKAKPSKYYNFAPLCPHKPTYPFVFRLRGHCGGEHLSGHGGAHPEVELAALRLKVGPPAGHALPV